MITRLKAEEMWKASQGIIPRYDLPAQQYSIIINDVK
jgi:hypothetical protein